MIQFSLHSDVQVDDSRSFYMVYNMTCANTLYGIECYKAGTDFSKPLNYAHVKDITSDEQFTVNLIKKLAAGNVMPIHIGDVVSDCLPYGDF